MDDDNISKYLNSLSQLEVLWHTWFSSSIVILVFSLFLTINFHAVVWMFACSAVACLITSYFVATRVHQLRIALSYCILGIVYKMLMLIFV